MVNHQYDKSFQWEQGFNNYLQRLQLGIQYSESKLLQLHIRLTGRMSDKLHVGSGSTHAQQGLHGMQHCGCFAACLCDWSDCQLPECVGP